MLKQLYRRFLRGVEYLPETVEHVKIFAAEHYAIVRKRPLYKQIRWTKAQQQEFDEFWKANYGKKISNRWHRLYEAVSGVHCIQYIPEMLYTTKIEPAWNNYRYTTVLENKSLLETLCKESQVTVPQTLLVCSAGTLLDGNRKPIKKAEAEELLRGAGDVVVKPTVGSSSGRGILFESFGMDVDPAIVDTLQKTLGNDFICQKRIVPHPTFAKFNATSINTIRVTTYILDGRVHHVPLAFRIGRASSNVDNIHAGGIGVGVEDDGILLPVGYYLGYGDKRVVYKEHPDSGVAFMGTKLPQIPQILEAAYDLQGRFPHIGIISWDFTVDNAGNVVLLEVNLKGQGVWFPQMIHGKSLFGENTCSALWTMKRGSR